jgi:hypothetical protein
LDTYKWQKVDLRPGDLAPSPRSGVQLMVYNDNVIVYGGYYKEVVKGVEEGWRLCTG